MTQYKKILFMLHGFIFVSSAIHSMNKPKNEWIGMEKYLAECSAIYKYCAKNKKNQNCAIINAHLLLLAGEKEDAEATIQFYEELVCSSERQIIKNSDSNFTQRLRLKEEKEYRMRRAEQSKIDLQHIVNQLKMGNLSENSQDNDKKLEQAFEAILKVTNNGFYITSELRSLENAQSKAKPKSKRETRYNTWEMT